MGRDAGGIISRSFDTNERQLGPPNIMNPQPCSRNIQSFEESDCEAACVLIQHIPVPGADHLWRVYQEGEAGESVEAEGLVPSWPCNLS